MQYGIESIGVKNFRSLKNLDPVEIKPITVLVGENSCGKSSFLRLLPLLKQSLEKNIDGPFAFFGEYVDFGDFDTVLNSSAHENKIELVIKGTIKKKNSLHQKEREKEFATLAYQVDLVFEKRKEGSVYASIVNIRLGEDIFLKFVINEHNYVEKVVINDQIYNQGKRLVAKYPNNLRSVIPFIVEKGYNDGKWISPNVLLDVKFDAMAEEEKKEVEKKVYGYEIINLQSRKKLIDTCRNISKKNADSLMDSIIYSHIPEILYTLNGEIFFSVENVNYAKPIRANTERYYRYQPEKTSEVSPDGSNLDQILANLTKSEMIEFDAWMKENFKFTVSISGGILKSINVKLENGVERNIIDMGYGYTQILPIIVQLWLSIKKKNTGVFPHDIIFAIEQPELHLHPGFQKKMLKVFCKTISLLKESEFKTRFLLETHSKVFVNALGECIENGDIFPEDVNILVFNNKDGCETTVTQSNFNSDGDLENWPIGFFN